MSARPWEVPADQEGLPVLRLVQLEESSHQAFRSLHRDINTMACILPPLLSIKCVHEQYKRDLSRHDRNRKYLYSLAGPSLCKLSHRVQRKEGGMLSVVVLLVSPTTLERTLERIPGTRCTTGTLLQVLMVQKQLFLSQQ